MEKLKTVPSNNKSSSTKDVQLTLPKLQIEYVELTVKGDSDLCTHKWSEKAKKEMRDKQAKVAKQAKEKRNPEQEYLDSLYVISGKAGDKGAVYGLPAVCFKSSAVDACSHIQGITKVEARGAFHVVGEMVTILDANTGKPHAQPYKREDMVRIGMGVADLRYRGAFKNWSCKLSLRYNSSVMTIEQIANLFNTAGFAMGVGEWRPQKNGSMGMFHVA